MEMMQPKRPMRKTIFEKRFTVTEEKLKAFGEASEDMNPLHFDEEFAQTTVFKGRIAHGMLSAGFISATITEAFGSGTIYVSQQLRFLSPVRIGDDCTVILITTKEEKTEADTKLTLNTGVVVGNRFDEGGQRFVIDGKAEILIPS